MITLLTIHSHKKMELVFRLADCVRYLLLQSLVTLNDNKQGISLFYMSASVRLLNLLNIMC